MRPLKFRAWDSLDKGFSNGGYCRYTSMQDSIVSLDSTISNSLIWSQYTGLLDKQGVEIYEGDIVKVCGERLFEVVFTDGCFNLKANNKEFVLAIAVQNSQVHECGLHVIGNRFENPELLENK